MNVSMKEKEHWKYQDLEKTNLTNYEQKQA